MISPILRNVKYERDLYTRRLKIGLYGVLVLALILVSRYAWLQTYQYQYYVNVSDNNRIQLRPLAPNRGLIYARDGRLIAQNLPSPSLVVIPELVSDIDATIAGLKEIIDLEEHEIKRFFRSLKRSPPSAQVPLRVGLDDEDIAEIAVNQHHFPGVELKEQLVRHYPYNNLFAHALGYLGSINPGERQFIRTYRKKDYQGIYVIGKTGVEVAYEDTLRGSSGFDHMEVNVRGRSQGLIKRQAAIGGKNLQLHLDIDMQRAARRAMGDYRGAVVALDVRTGGVVVMLSMPDFNANEYVMGLSASDVQRKERLAGQPLFNRSIAGRYAPASTFKPVVGLAGLDGFVDLGDTVQDPGYYVLGERIYYDWLDGGHGTVNMFRALVESCDTYFYDLGIKMGQQPIAAMAQKFGVGQITGIDLKGESSGILPGNDWKLANVGERWFTGDTLNMSIGQGYLLMTPLQMAVMAMGLANKGKRWKPQVVRAIDGREVGPVVAEETSLPEEHWSLMQQSLEGVVHSYAGTAHMIADNLDYRIAGKTGTSQITALSREVPEEQEVVLNEKGIPMRPQQQERDFLLRDHAVFIAYAPAENPTLAVAVVVENGQLGGAVAGPVARTIFDTWLASER